MNERLNHAEFIIRNFVTNIDNYIKLLNNFTKKSGPQNVPLLRILRLTVAVSKLAAQNYSPQFWIEKCR